MPLGRSHGRRNVTTPWKVPSLAGRQARIEGELWSLRGEHDNQSVEGKTERDLHRWSIPPLCTPQPETLVPGVVGGWVLKRGLQRSTWGENWDWLSGDSLKGLEQGVAATEGICRRSLSQPEWQGTIVGGCSRRGVGPISLGQESATQKMSGGEMSAQPWTNFRPRKAPWGVKG